MIRLLKNIFSKTLNEELLHGKWYGIKNDKDGSSLMTCSTYEANGAAEVHFKQKFNVGGPYEVIEEGAWSLEKDLLIKNMKDHYGSTNNNRYQILKLTEDRLVYKSLNTGTIYRQEKSSNKLEKKWESFLPFNNDVPRPPKPRSKDRPILPELKAEVDFNDPKKITIAFIKEYEEWNEFALKIDNQNIILDYATEAYENLVRKYSTDGLEAQNIAFGSRSSHSLENENIENSEIKEESAIIYTKHTKDLAGTILEDNYEYHYLKTDKGWRLKNLLVVFENEKVKCI